MAQFAKQKGVKRLFLSSKRRPVLGRIRRRRGKRSEVPGNPDRRRRSVRPERTELRSVRSTYRIDPRRRGRALGVPASQHPLTAARSPRRPRSTCSTHWKRGLPGPGLLPRRRACRPRDVHRLSRRGHLAPPPGRKTVPRGSQSPHRQAEPVLHRLRRPVSPRSCSTRSPAPTAPAPRSPRNCSRRESRTASSATSASTRTATRSKHPSPSGASSAPHAQHRTVTSPTESSSADRHSFPESR